MAFSEDHIRERTAADTKKDIGQGMVVSPADYRRLSGIHPVMGRKLDTPTSYIAGKVESFLADLDLTADDQEKVEKIVMDVVCLELSDKVFAGV